jgi:DNA-binding transcriptional LysR family regulator
MDWDSLRVFLAVVRAGRLSTAAKGLGVEHTTVARRLGALERALGVPLFYRTAAGHLLTPHGEAIRAGAEAMERAALAVGVRAREGAGRVTGRVRLAIVPEMASHWLARHHASFRALHPEIELRVVVGTRPLDLSRGEAELAVRSPRPRQEGLVAARIARAGLALYATRSLAQRRRLYIRGPEDVRGVPLLVYTPEFHELQNAAWFQPVLASAAVALSTNSTHLLLAAAHESAGVAVLPRFVAREDGTLVAVSDEVAANDVWLITHPEFRRDPRVRATADFLKRIAKGKAGIE